MSSSLLARSILSKSSFFSFSKSFFSSSSKCNRHSRVFFSSFKNFSISHLSVVKSSFSNSKATPFFCKKLFCSSSSFRNCSFSSSNIFKDLSNSSRSLFNSSDKSSYFSLLILTSSSSFLFRIFFSCSKTSIDFSISIRFLLISFNKTSYLSFRLINSSSETLSIISLSFFNEISNFFSGNGIKLSISKSSKTSLSSCFLSSRDFKNSFFSFSSSFLSLLIFNLSLPSSL
ncbi:MAG: hypothetical protein BWY64_03666 [bacterium ADurb.Bin363]|nr:MAG: hypothetical protein BWY64_03666 [bacterium ADurb.Bin363]